MVWFGANASRYWALLVCWFNGSISFFPVGNVVLEDRWSNFLDFLVFNLCCLCCIVIVSVWLVYDFYSLGYVFLWENTGSPNIYLL